MLTTEAFNALLKTLEEPPAHVKFIFATTDPQKVPATILSRCQRFDFRPVPDKDIVRSLRQICIDENLVADEEALVAIARASSGGMRDAQSTLDQLGTLGAGKVLIDDLHALLGTVSADRMRHLFDALALGDAKAALAEAGEILDAGTDPAELLRQCLRHAHDLMIAKALGPRGEGESELRRALDAQAKVFGEATLVHCVTIFGEALKNSKLLGESRLFAETALARLAGHRDMRFLDQMVREVQSLERRLAAGGAATPAAPPSRVAAPIERAAAPVERTFPAGVAERPVAASEPAAPAESPPPATETAPASPGIDLTLDAIRGRWNDVLEASRSAGSRLRTALAAATIEGLRGEALVLGFTPDASFHRSALTAPDTRETVAALLETVFGRRLRFETTEIAKDPAAAAPAAEASRRAEQQGERLTAAERASAEQAPITRLVEKELKARIVHMERTSERGAAAPARSGELADPSRQD